MELVVTFNRHYHHSHTPFLSYRDVTFSGHINKSDHTLSQIWYTFFKKSWHQYCLSILLTLANYWQSLNIKKEVYKNEIH